MPRSRSQLKMCVIGNGLRKESNLKQSELRADSADSPGYANEEREDTPLRGSCCW